MKILILSTSIVNGFHRWNTLRENSNDYLSLICNPKKKSQLSFLLRQIFQITFRFSLLNKIKIINLVLRQTIKISSKDVHSKKIVNWISKNKIDIGIHGINVIYKDYLLDSFNIGILNAHLGLLPRYRGKSVVAWSLLENNPTGISTFLIDKGIDTGKNIIHSEPIVLENCKNTIEAKKKLSSTTGEMYKLAIEKISDSNFQFLENDISKGKRYYVMSDLLTEFVELLLNSDIKISIK